MKIWKFAYINLCHSAEFNFRLISYLHEDEIFFRFQEQNAEFTCEFFTFDDCRFYVVGWVFLPWYLLTFRDSWKWNSDFSFILKMFQYVRIRVASKKCRIFLFYQKLISLILLNKCKFLLETWHSIQIQWVQYNALNNSRFYHKF